MKRILLFLLLTGMVSVTLPGQVVSVQKEGDVILDSFFDGAHGEDNADAIIKGINKGNEIIDRERIGEGPYAVIEIQLPPGSAYTDFELKASSQNFTGGEMVFFYHSPDPIKAIEPAQIWTNKPDVYYTSSGKVGDPNRRAWLKQGSTSIFASLEDADSLVGGFLIVVKDDLRQYRSNIVFSYCLMDGANYEQDTAGRSVWRPARVVEWVTGFDPNE